MKFLKKKIRRKGLILGLIVIFVFTFCMNSTIIVNATVQKGEKAYVKVKRNLNMREAPKLNAKIIEKLSPGEIVTILSIEDEKWVQVETSNKEIGFVCMDYLVIPEVDVDEYELLSVAVITKTGGSSANRNFNMAKAAEAIDGVVLDPEEEFAWYSTENTEEYSIMFEVYTDGPQVVVVAYKVLD